MKNSWIAIPAAVKGRRWPRPGVVHGAGVQAVHRDDRMAYSWFRSRYDLAFSRFFQQQGAALAATDAGGGNAAGQLQALQRIGQMQHDAAAAGTHRMTEADGTAVDVEAVMCRCAEGAVEAEFIATEIVALPRAQASQHLCGEGLVDFPQVHIAHTELLALQQGGGAEHRTQSHHGGV